MLAGITAQSAHLELSAGLQSMNDSASLLPRCADHGDYFLIVLCFHINFSVFLFFSGENSKSRDFQNDLAARMSGLAQFMSTPDVTQGQDSFYHRPHLAG